MATSQSPVGRGIHHVATAHESHIVFTTIGTGSRVYCCAGCLWVAHRSERKTALHQPQWEAAAATIDRLIAKNEELSGRLHVGCYQIYQPYVTSSLSPDGISCRQQCEAAAATIDKLIAENEQLSEQLNRQRHSGGGEQSCGFPATPIEQDRLRLAGEETPRPSELSFCGELHPKPSWLEALRLLLNRAGGMLDCCRPRGISLWLLGPCKLKAGCAQAACS